MKKLKLELTPRQWNLIVTALFEYAGVCDQDSLNNDGTTSDLHKLSKDLIRCSREIWKQRLRLEKVEKRKKPRGDK
jgi:hypothetical protein